VGMRLDGDTTAVVASAAVESLWGVVGLIQQARDHRWPSSSVGSLFDDQREWETREREPEARRREESRRREEEAERQEREQELKREGKLQRRDHGGAQNLIAAAAAAAASSSPSPARFFFTVGYALSFKKIKSFIQPKFEIHARTKGITLVAIDRSKVLADQGPFDIILHKVNFFLWGPADP
jgi:hypothetical protein